MSAPEKFAIGSTEWAGLSKLAEEAGEVVQVIGKLLATGGDTAHWDGTDLADRLSDEVADLRAALMFVVAHNGPRLGGTDRLNARTEAKFELFQRWHCEQSHVTAAGSGTERDTQ